MRRLLPRLLPLLDGTRTVAEVVELVGAPVEQAVHKALALLAERGLLAAGPPPDCGGELAATVGYLAATGGLPPAIVAGRIADARVGLVGGGTAAVEVARVLRRAGVPRIERRGWGDARRGTTSWSSRPPPRTGLESGSGTRRLSRRVSRGCRCFRTTGGSRRSGPSSSRASPRAMSAFCSDARQGSASESSRTCSTLRRCGPKAARPRRRRRRDCRRARPPLAGRRRSETTGRPVCARSRRRPRADRPRRAPRSPLSRLLDSGVVGGASALVPDDSAAAAGVTGLASLVSPYVGLAPISSRSA